MFLKWILTLRNFVEKIYVKIVKNGKFWLKNLNLKNTLKCINFSEKELIFFKLIFHFKKFKNIFNFNYSFKITKTLPDYVMDEYYNRTTITSTNVNYNNNLITDKNVTSNELTPHVPVVRVVRKRTTANKKERRRTMSINSAYTNLRDHIPNVPSDTKLSKVKILFIFSSHSLIKLNFT